MKTKKLLAGLAILVVFICSQCGKNTTVPDELTGIWRTASPKYEGCFFEFRTNTITIGPLEGEPSTFAITNIKRKKESNEEWALYTIFYVDKGEEYEFPLYFLLEKGGVIRFKNQLDIAWTRESQ
jgi:hypothetical protein